MSSVEKIDFPKMRVLHAQLAKYGLNPNDWRFKHASHKTRGKALEMHHCDDADFRFEARLERTPSGRAYLKSLTLVSI